MMCMRCMGIKKLVAGVLLLLNAFVWPRWLGIDGWVSFVAVLMVIGGFIAVVVPNKCPSCNAMMAGPAKAAASPAKKRRRR